MREGQLVQVHYKDEKGAYWHYAIVTNVYDGKAELVNEIGIRHMWDYKETPESKAAMDQGYIDKNAAVSLMLRDGMPVIAKRGLFGKYKFPKRSV